MKINNSEFAYMIGNFLADGSFYKTKQGENFGYRFEFTDGSPYKNELKYSIEHLLKIKKILEYFLNKKLPDLRKRGNSFVLCFRDKKLSKLFLTSFNFSPGDKSKTIDIPSIYKNSKYEKDLWIGFLDGDGSIARKSRRIAVESMSKFIIESFASYLIKNKILFSKYESKRMNGFSYVILIKSVSFRDFAQKIGFKHPLKLKLLNEKLKDNDFFIKNRVKFKLGQIDYIKIFDDSIFIENGRELLIKYGNKSYHRPNVRFSEIVGLMKKKRLSNGQILKEINHYRFKKSKGSINSIRLPLLFNNELLKISNFIRIREGGISFSKAYIESFSEDYSNILKITEKLFDIKPVYTCKNEPIFCSGVLKDFFDYIIERS